MVRYARVSDWSAIREICCLTGDAGEPIARARWRFFAELWIGPYERLVPDWTFVAETAERLAGYLTGCPDTTAFERARAFRITLPLLARVAAGRYGWTDDTRRFVHRVFGLARLPEDRFPSRQRVDYPAHFHMNVAAGLRGRGLGATLLTRYLEALRERGIPGVHLFCGPGPVRFYARHGFAEIGHLDLPGGVRVFALARGV